MRILNMTEKITRHDENKTLDDGQLEMDNLSNILDLLNKKPPVSLIENSRLENRLKHAVLYQEHKITKISEDIHRMASARAAEAAKEKQ